MTEDKELLHWLDRSVQRIIEPSRGRSAQYVAMCVGYDDGSVSSGYFGCGSVELATAAGILAQDGAALCREEAEGMEEFNDDED